MKEAIFTLIGIGMIYIGYFSLKKNRQLKKNGIQTVAKVISNRLVGRSRNTSDSDTESHAMYSETVEFKTDKDEIIVVELGDSSAAETPIGTERKIIYDPRFPEKAMANNALSLVIAPYLFALCGLFLVVWGVMQFLK